MYTKTSLLTIASCIALILIFPLQTKGAEGTIENPQGTVATPPAATQTQGVQTLTLPDPLHGATIEGLLHKIVTWLRLIAAPIAAGMIIYGAYQMLFAAGDPEKFKVGRQTILYTVIGYAIIWIGWGITKIIEEFLSTP